MEPMTGIEPVDLFLTKEALYRLSYMGSNQPGRPADPSAGWSGRRDSNSRHPAWKAGALPAELHPLRPRTEGTAPFRCSLPVVLVGREGFEPSKAVGRQIYSLMRLTASLPTQDPALPSPLPRPYLVELAMGFEPATC